MLGLDLGSSEFRSVSLRDGRLTARRVPAAYCVLPNQPAHQRMLEQLGIPFMLSPSDLLVYGPQIGLVRSLLGVPLVPVLPGGRLALRDPVSRQLCDLLLGTILPENSGDLAAGVCLPGASQARAQFSETHQFLHQILRLRLADVRHFDSGTSVVLAELGSAGLTGLGVTVGATAICFGFCRAGQTYHRFHFPQGTRSVSEYVARARHHYHWDTCGNKFLDLTHAERGEVPARWHLASPRTGEEQMVRDRLQKLLHSAWTALTIDLTRHSDIFPRRQHLPVIVSGGIVHLPGFLDLFTQTFASAKLPFSIAALSAASRDPYTVARGGLIGMQAGLGEIPRRVAS